MRRSFPGIRESYWFLIPLLFFIISFILAPVLGTIANSFYRDVQFLPLKFAGLQNYIKLIGDPGFTQALKFTLLFTITSVSLEIVLGLGVALLLSYPFRLRGLLRAIVLIPWAIPAAISARTWELVYNYNYGLANALLSRAGASEMINWLGTETSAFAAIVIADVWKTTPFVAIIVLSGLSAIPDALYAQARVDGAHAFDRLCRITIPLLKPVLVVTLLFRTIDALRIFDLNYVLTHGGPGGSTTSLSLYGYKYFLAGDFGYGSAVSVLLFMLAFVLSVLYIKIGSFNKGI